EGRGLPLTADSPKDGDAARIGVIGRTARKRYRLNKRHLASNRELPRLLHRTVDGHDVRRRFLDGDADVGMLEELLPEELRQMVVQLRSREVGRFDLADERQRNAPREIDRIIARNGIARRLSGIVSALTEQLDRQLVEGRNLVVFRKRLEM